jgi:hypothetical protein
MEPSQAGDDTGSPPLCATHQQPSSATCTRCGVFTCARCPESGLCSSCEGPEALRATAVRKVRIPAILMIVLGAVVFVLLGVLLIQQLTRPPVELPPGMDPGSEQALRIRTGRTITLVVPLVGYAVSVVVLLGGIHMLRLRRYWLASLAAFLTMCCGFPLAGAGLAIGLWAIWALGQPPVRAGFKAQARRDDPHEGKG